MSGSAFKVAAHGSLEQAGLAGGPVKGRVDGGTLTLADAGGSLVIPAASVDRLRHFRMGKVHELNYGSQVAHETKIWWSGRRDPILLMPSGDKDGFFEGIGDFAAGVEVAHGPGRLHIGPGATTAVVNLAIVGIPLLGLLAYVGWVALEDGGWWWLGAALIALFFGWLGGRSILSRWPRRVSLDRFRAELR